MLLPELPDLDTDINDGLNSVYFRDERERLTSPGSLLTFVRDVWHLVEPGQPFLDNWHINALCDLLEDVTAGRVKRLIVNIPPGCMKSLLITVIWPCWMWARNARLRVLTATYSDTRALDANLKARDIVTSSWFQERFDVTLSSNQNAKGRFDTTERGWRIATSVDGEGIGLHPNIIIIDDPIKPKEVTSEIEREAVNRWYDTSIATRLGRTPAIVIIMQRLHEEDLSGHLLKSPGWMHVCWPMEFDPKRADATDPRTIEGELLWPSLHTVDKVTELKHRLGVYGSSGQLQQRPVPEGGGQFQRGWFKTIPAAPADARWCRGYDTAGTEGGGDYTAGAKVGLTPGGRICIANVVRGQWSPANVDKTILNTAKSDGKDCWVREEQEGGSSGKTVIAARAKSLYGFDYRGVHISGDKINRSRALRSQVEAGNVYLLVTGDPVRDAWIEPFLQELSLFPVGKHDDQVDAVSCAYNSLIEEQSNLPKWDDPRYNVLAGKLTW